ncbi:MAG: HD domain-containing protein [Candidatus Gastranaerophilales bacterium]|nr:HD domain-containing protein [Candidatus Gastranaerophilales bacterium]
MKPISVDDLINLKILPFDIYNSKGKVIFYAGEILTPGKVLQLKYINELYIDEEKGQETDDELLELLNEDETPDKTVTGESLHPAEIIFKKQVQSPVITEEFKNEVTNKNKEMIDRFIDDGAADPMLCMEVRDSIIDEILPEVSKILYRSQLKIMGDYYYVHGLNVATLSAVLAHRMKLSTQAIKDITLAGMLHDIGKLKIPEDIIRKASYMSPNEVKVVQLHPRLGYKILKDNFGVSENIAKVALQHHERNDGSGYPFGISGNFISLESSIVSICNVYDQLTSGKGEVRVKNTREAVKYLLNCGTKHFKSEVLYTFVHMTNYNDLAPITIDFS